MRIISGSARGTNLFTLDGLTTRPTLDRVKESLFNIIQNEICDKSKEAVQIINKNIEKTHLKEKVELYNVDYKELIKNKLKEKIDIVYIDPPYDSDFAVDAVKLLIENKLVDEKTLIIIETDQEKRILKQLENEKLKIQITDKRKYGRAIIIFLKLEESQN